MKAQVSSPNFRQKEVSQVGGGFRTYLNFVRPAALRARRAFSVIILLGPFRPQSTTSTFDTFTFDVVNGVRRMLQ